MDVPNDLKLGTSVEKTRWWTLNESMFFFWFDNFKSVKIVFVIFFCGEVATFWFANPYRDGMPEDPKSPN